MSSIANPTPALFDVENAEGGFNIQGFFDRVNRLNGSDGNDFIIGGRQDDILCGLSRYPNWR